MPRRFHKNAKAAKNINSGLGNAMKNKFGGKPERENKASGRVKRKSQVVDSPFHTRTAAASDKKLVSVTEVSSLQEFVDTMKMQQEQQAAQEATEEVKLMEYDPQQSMESKEKLFHQALVSAELFNYENLPIPRKPSWDESTTKDQLLEMEREAFLNWRRSLAHTAEESHLEMTPFEKNIEIWKQLWRVIERSQVLILIVDARNPLAFISRDLFTYVAEVSHIRKERKQCILMINKADYLTPLQRQFWRRYFEKQHIRVLFFSAMREQIRFDILTKSNRDKLSQQQTNVIMENVLCHDAPPPSSSSSSSQQQAAPAAESEVSDVLTVERLMDVFNELRTQQSLEVIEVGMIGYPNVGKSSIINVLMGAKKVSVGSTPGKTKHFQTLQLSETVTLCDCPGLVFPTLMHSKADMVLNGVIPIDNLTDFITPSRLMVHRLSIKQINQCYKLRLPENKKHSKLITVYDVLDSYCRQRGLLTKSKVPNRNEAARVMLKDYMKGKMVYNHFPPTLTSRKRFLFYHGKFLYPASCAADHGVDLNANHAAENEAVVNVLDQDKLSGAVPPIQEASDSSVEDNGGDGDSDGDVDVDDETQPDDAQEHGNDITDEEFLNLWRHPMTEYGGMLGSSKKKHEKKARVMRKLEKRTQKGNRKYRRDSDNFESGSNAVIVSAVPHIKARNAPVLL